jgi:tetratricopeptide (TPR) repeat protein
MSIFGRLFGRNRNLAAMVDRTVDQSVEPLFPYIASTDEPAQSEIVEAQQPESDPATQSRPQNVQDIPERTSESHLIKDSAETIAEPISRASLQRALFLARDEKRWHDVIECGARLRAAAPEEPSGYVLPAQAHLTLDEPIDADRLLSDAVTRFPDLEHVWGFYVHSARVRSDWPEVVRRSRQTREKFPTSPAGYIHEIFALRSTSRASEALVLIARAQDAFPTAAWPFIDAAWVARAARDWDYAAKAAAICIQKFPENETGYSVGATAGRELGRLDSAIGIVDQAEARFGTKPWMLIERAEIAFRGGDPDASWELWKRLITAEPNSEHGYRRGVQVGIAAGKHQEAEALLETAATKLPPSDWIFLELARCARFRGDHAAADAALRKGILAVPSVSPELEFELAIAPMAARAEKHRDIPETLLRLGQYRLRFPDDPRGWTKHSSVLRHAGDLETARLLVEEAERRFAGNVEIRLEAARIELASGKRDTALAKFQAAAENAPDSSSAALEVIRTLVVCGRHEEAERAAEAACCTWPRDPELARTFAEIGTAVLPASAAFERWKAALSKFPGNWGIAAGWYGARLESDAAAASELLDRSRARKQDEVRVFGSQAKEDIAALLGAFESLGGTGQGCEFGIVQRYGSAEPLGLLRWTRIVAENLIEALENDFAGVGSAEQTRLAFYNSPDDPEYVLDDTRYLMRMHTFIRKSQAGPEELLRKMQTRLKLLRRKLLEDLSLGEKVFVFKEFQRTLDSHQLDRLVGALGRHGDNTLLYVQYADSRHQPGSCVRASRNLLIGYISQFSMTDTGEGRAPEFGEWLSICRQAHQLFILTRRLPHAHEPDLQPSPVGVRELT